MQTNTTAQAVKTSFGIILPIIIISYFMIILDNSIIFTGSVKIAQEFGLNQSQLSWVSNAYALTFGGFLLFGGRAGDIFGRKNIFNAGLVIFGLGSLFVSIAPSLAVMIPARAFQGLGSAILAPTSLALLMDTYTGETRTRAIALYGSTAGLGAAAGLILGGLCASLWTWRIGFLINVPISLVMLLGSLRFVHSSQQTKSGTLDLPGTILSVVGIVALVYALVGSVAQGLSLVIAVLFIATFILREAKTKNPMMPLRLFADRERLTAYIGRFFYLAAMMTFWYFTPQAMQRVLGFSPLTTAFMFIPLTVVNFIVALQVAPLTKKFGNRRVLLIGVSLTFVGLLSMQLFRVWPNYLIGLALPMILTGAGQGLALSPLTVAGVANTTASESGAASGVVNMLHQIGGAVGVAVVVSITGKIVPFVHQFNTATLLVAALMAVSIIAVCFMPKQKG
ncbi:MFS transporter [Lacticaseibacillus porcinae]|uniref:MFS transporter n=1 Tax=Lacticaseibacillus porcinae TaxID=1123687 RepID=UPI000F7AC324|nr:MFS transporter [Lacticaseibacillus porcinae]